MDVLVLIDRLDDLVHGASTFPMTDKVMIDRDEIYDLLDQMRATIPEEIKQARWIVKERQEMLQEAKEEAERILTEGRDEAQRLASEQEVVKRAQRQAEDIVREAEAREREIRLGAEDYADEILKTLETNLDRFLAAVHRGRERLQSGPSQRGLGTRRCLFALILTSFVCAEETGTSPSMQSISLRSPLGAQSTACFYRMVPRSPLTEWRAGIW
jgi:vacuolar-type H+-ATPase subunit H